MALAGLAGGALATLRHGPSKAWRGGLLGLALGGLGAVAWAALTQRPPRTALERADDTTSYQPAPLRRTQENQA